jgi:hypothetical protein
MTKKRVQITELQPGVIQTVTDDGETITLSITNTTGHDVWLLTESGTLERDTMKLSIRSVIGYSLIAIGCVGIIWLRFTHIDMTGTRMMVSLWREFLVVVGFVFLGAWIIQKDY